MAFRILDLRCGGQQDYEAFKTHAEGLSRRFTYLIYIIRIRAYAHAREHIIYVSVRGRSHSGRRSVDEEKAEEMFSQM